MRFNLSTRILNWIWRTTLRQFGKKIHSVEIISSNINQKYEDSKHLFGEFTDSVGKMTKDYLHIVDEKLNEYKEFISKNLNCLDCLKDLINTISSMENLKESLIKESKSVMSNLEGLELNMHLEELNDKLIKFKDELLEKLESKELDWIDIFNDSQKHDNHKVKKWPIFVMLFGAIICLSGSTTFHLFSVHSEKWNEFLSRLDYAGISLLILGSTYPPYYYYFYCREGLRIFYLTFMTIFCVSTFLVSLTAGFNKPIKRKNERNTVFSSWYFCWNSYYTFDVNWKCPRNDKKWQLHSLDYRWDYLYRWSIIVYVQIP